MAGGGRHASAPPRSGRRRIVTVGLAVAGGVLVALGLHGDLGKAEAPIASPQARPAKGSVTLPPTLSLTARPGAKVLPTSLRIPAIQVSSDVTGLGLNKDQTVEVPKDPAAVGWYTQGPAPGEPGSSVMLGHVDSKKGPAVFYRLRNLNPADRVAVRLSDGTVAHFEVIRVASYANEDFPAREVYAGNNDRPVLNLVTCGGEYDRAAGGYQSNVVVYTRYLWASSSDA